MDAYKQSQYHPELLGDLATRMSWVYRRTGVAMAITSATTCAAFLCTLITPLPGVQSFGVFAAVVIFIDYVLVMSLFCTAVIIYHQRFEGRAKFGCCFPCGVQDPTPTEKALAKMQESGDEAIKRDRVSEFFRNKVAKFVQVPFHRLVIFVVFGTWMCIAIWQALQLEATKVGFESCFDPFIIYSYYAHTSYFFKSVGERAIPRRESSSSKVYNHIERAVPDS